MRGPPVAPPLPRPPPPPPMMLPPTLQGQTPPNTSQPIQHMAAAPQVWAYLCMCWGGSFHPPENHINCIWHIDPNHKKHLWCKRNGLCGPCFGMFHSGHWYGLDGVSSTVKAGSSTSHQGNTNYHPGSTHRLLCSSGSRRTQKKRYQSSETSPNGISICIDA